MPAYLTKDTTLKTFLCLYPYTMATQIITAGVLAVLAAKDFWPHPLAVVVEEIYQDTAEFLEDRNIPFVIFYIPNGSFFT